MEVLKQGIQIVQASGISEKFVASVSSNSSVAATGSVICGILAVGVVAANIYEDIETYKQNKDIVQLAVNTSIVVGSTTIGAVAGNAYMGSSGIGYGMLGGSLVGTFIKRQNIFGFSPKKKSSF